MNTICALCHITNPVPEDHLADGAKCGRCGHGLFGGGVINATATTLDQLRQGDLPVVVGFWAPWCRPCRSIPTIMVFRAGRMANILNGDAESAV